MTASAIYEGHVRHRRYREREHEFRYGVAMAYVDLDELPSLVGGRLLRDRPGLVRFRRADYLGDPATPLADAVRARIAEECDGWAPQGPIRLLTHLRTCGHCFNPVSFYYCFAADGERLEAIVAEVTSTPWGERHAYVLPRDSESPVLGGGFDKALHVSPFMEMDQRYAWRAPAPGRTLSVHIESEQDGVRAFDATLGLKRRPFSKRALAGMVGRYPAASLRMLALIYSHAVVLRAKGVRVKPHPGGVAT